MPGGKPEGQGSPSIFAERLDALITTQRPDGQVWTNEEVSDGLRRIGGPSVSTAYVQQLRRGRRDKPSWPLVVALARLFGVPVGYFSGEDQESVISADDLRLLNAVRTPELRDLVQKLDGIGPQARQVIARLIDEVRLLDS
ncbi:helix-turn-helix domain-containing protein [Pseudonocardia sp. ICBG1142]|uniref:helix-turn-helix domain-containing protein n=1 Tax=Pseudonocardia sp. ICBG1142 TaxID=2846760 RepID=UPI001CF6DED8|nr:helix-turn-helix transcriptional regulator [Pseudonocardia sp. ICBG1142]